MGPLLILISAWRTRPASLPILTRVACIARAIKSALTTNGRGRESWAVRTGSRSELGAPNLASGKFAYCAGRARLVSTDHIRKGSWLAHQAIINEATISCSDPPWSYGDRNPGCQGAVDGRRNNAAQRRAGKPLGRFACAVADPGFLRQVYQTKISPLQHDGHPASGGRVATIFDTWLPNEFCALGATV